MEKYTQSDSFDFDSWMKLAESDPQTFEIERNNIIEAAILAAPERNRVQLRRLQWKLDRIRETAPNPLSACIRMQELLWHSVLGEDGLVARLNQLPSTIDAEKPSAEIIEFRR